MSGRFPGYVKGKLVTRPISGNEKAGYGAGIALFVVGTVVAVICFSVYYTDWNNCKVRNYMPAVSAQLDSHSLPEFLQPFQRAFDTLKQQAKTNPVLSGRFIHKDGRGGGGGGAVQGSGGAVRGGVPQGPGVPLGAYDALLNGAPLPNTMARNALLHNTGAAVAQAVDDASRAYAAAVNAGGMTGGGQQASPTDVAAVVHATTTGYPEMSMIDPGTNSPYLQYQYQSAIKTVAGASDPLPDVMQQLEFLDPEGAAKLKAAFSQSSTPSRFFADDATAASIQATETAKAIRKQGKLGLTPEELLDGRPTWVPTAAAIRRSILGTQVDKTFVTQFPLRTVYPDMLEGSRLQTPRVQITKDTVINEPISPGLDNYLASLACNICPMKTMEPL